VCLCLCVCVCVFGGLFVVAGVSARACSVVREREGERVRESRQNEEDDNFALLLLTSRLCHFFSYYYKYSTLRQF